MTYSLLPHKGAFSAESVVHPAYELNVPAFTLPGKAEKKQFLSVGAPNIIAEAVKPAEDDSNAFVVRLYECEGTKTKAKITAGIPVSGAELTNLLEDTDEEIPVRDGAVELSFRPFEIKTVKFRKQ